MRVGMTRTLAAMFVALTVGSAAGAGEERWVVGQAFVPFTLADQHDRSHDVGAATRLVLVSYDMDGGALVRTALDERPDALAAAGAVYVANTARMPGFVTRMFALPRMRKRPYPVLLDRDGTVTRALVAGPNQAVAVRLADGAVTAIEPLGSVGDVRRALGIE